MINRRLFEKKKEPSKSAFGVCIEKCGIEMSSQKALGVGKKAWTEMEKPPGNDAASVIGSMAANGKGAGNFKNPMCIRGCFKYKTADDDNKIKEARTQAQKIVDTVQVRNVQGSDIGKGQPPAAGAAPAKSVKAQKCKGQGGTWRGFGGCVNAQGKKMF